MGWSPTTAATTPSRTPASTPARLAAADPGLGVRPEATDVAARIGDGFVTVQPDNELVERYRKNGGKGPAIAALKVCWHEDEKVARKLAHELWPTEGVEGQLAQELALPSHFEAAAANVTEEMVAEQIACGPDPDKHVVPSTNTSTRDSTRCTSTRSARTRRVSSASTSGNSAHDWTRKRKARSQSRADRFRTSRVRPSSTPQSPRESKPRGRRVGRLAKCQRVLGLSRQEGVRRLSCLVTTLGRPNHSRRDTFCRWASRPRSLQRRKQATWCV